MTDDFKKQELELIEKLFKDLERPSAIAADAASRDAIDSIRKPDDKQAAARAARSVAVADDLKKYAETARQSVIGYRSNLWRLLEQQESSP